MSRNVFRVLETEEEEPGKLPLQTCLLVIQGRGGADWGDLPAHFKDPSSICAVGVSPSVEAVPPVCFSKGFFSSWWLAKCLIEVEIKCLLSNSLENYRIITNLSPADQFYLFGETVGYAVCSTRRRLCRLLAFLAIYFLVLVVQKGHCVSCPNRASV